jgi:hypothetical protein
MSSNSKRGGWEPRLIGQYPFDEASSALQKACRRGQEYNAVFFAYVLHTSGYGDYVWRRLSIIVSEDIGGGDNNAAILISCLRESWERLHKRVKEPTLDKFLFIVHAVLYMCRASKSRENDSVANLVEENWKNGQRLEVPPEAKDSHTEVGRKEWGRFGDLTDGLEAKRIEMWLSEWAKVNKTAYPDKWEKELKNIWLQKAKGQPILTNSQSSTSKSTADRD